MKLLMIWILLAGVCACMPFSERYRSKADMTGFYGAQVGIVNHTEKYIYSSRVGDGAGGHSSAYSNGIANICCVTVPDKWYPGLKFLVSWDMPIGITHTYKEKVVEVEKYDEPGSIYLHFFPDDQVRIVVTTWAGGAPEHPIPRATKPAALTKAESPTK